MNEWGYAQVAKSVSAITAISFPPYACCGVPETAWSPGFLRTCEIFVNGRFLAIAASPDGNVEDQWFPHCVVRTQTAENLQVSTRMFLPSKHRAVVQSITVRNLSAAQRRFTLSFDMRGAVAKKTKPWFVNSPGEADNRVTWDAQRGCLLFEAQLSEIAGVRGFHPAPSRVEQTRILHCDMELGPREQEELKFVLTIAENGRAAIELYASLQARFAHLEKENEGKGWQSGSDWPSAFRRRCISAAQRWSFQVIGRRALHRRLVQRRCRRFTELVIDSIFGPELTLSNGIRVNSHLGSFDSSARLGEVRYQGGLSTITKDGAQRERA